MNPGKAPRKSKPTFEVNEKIFRLLFDNHPLPMWMYDLESLAFLEVNIAAPLSRNTVTRGMNSSR